VLCAIASLAAAWGALRLETALRITLGPRLVGTWPVILASLAVVALGLGFYALVHLRHPAGWLRGLALGALVVAVVWVPTALAAAVLPRGAGPVTALYHELGDPPAGRWAALALAVLLTALAAGPLSAIALGTARGWMRADATEFRRRLVRVVAGWPAALATALLLWKGGWAPSPVSLVWPALVLAALHLRTR